MAFHSSGVCAHPHHPICALTQILGPWVSGEVTWPMVSGQNLDLLSPCHSQSATPPESPRQLRGLKVELCLLDIRTLASYVPFPRPENRDLTQSVVGALDQEGSSQTVSKFRGQRSVHNEKIQIFLCNQRHLHTFGKFYSPLKNK